MIKAHFSWKRLLKPTLVGLSSITITNWVAARLDLEAPVMFKAPFLFCAGVGAIVGYYSGKSLKSVLALMVSGVLAILAALFYWNMRMLVVGYSIWKATLLGLLYALIFAAFYLLLRILYNLGLR